MTCDVEFLAEVNAALAGARFDWLGINLFEGWLELSHEPHRYRISWSGWLSEISSPTVGSDVHGYVFAAVIGPMIGMNLSEIQHRNGVYELRFSNGQSVFAGHWSSGATDHVLMVESITDNAPFTWGLLD
ncbi:hypothetical protein [Brevundimonas naejangsanensis]|uniref:hypothetical protein n=1 Tax=Brevundimonas naejangsanensis TaxID=588932 RepID=UPI0026F0595F|nr:hypothetical protein [Brevundimonas naejangsanensis]